MATRRNTTTPATPTTDPVATAFAAIAQGASIVRLVDTLAVAANTPVNELCSFVGNAREIQDAQFLATKKMAHGRLDIELVQDVRTSNYLAAVLEKARRQAATRARSNRNTETGDVF